MPYQVLDWNEHFENSKSRTYDHCSYVCMPNKQGGMGLTRILSEPDGATVIGIWVLILQVLSQQKKPREGWLTDDGQQTGRAWTVSDLAMRWRRTDAEITRALQVLSAPNVGWLKQLETVPAQYPSSIPEVSVQGTRDTVNKEQNSNEQNRTDKSIVACAATPCVQVFEYWKQEHGKRDTTIFGGKRKRAVEQRLKDGNTVEYIMQAIRGIKLDPHCSGKNDTGTVYNELELICRDQIHLDRYAALDEPRRPRATESPPAICSKCSNTGTVIVYSPSTDTDVPIACGCQYGLRRSA